ncbi:MAG: YezD family protein [Proteobacteria bacterium]|nr:YezD family protein [Pseudomonadota bacterium]
MPGDPSSIPQRVPSSAVRLSEAPLEAVADAVSRLRYGVVQLTVHDGKVVQLDVTERQRFG